MSKTNRLISILTLVGVWLFNMSATVMSFGSRIDPLDPIDKQFFPEKKPKKINHRYNRLECQSPLPRNNSTIGADDGGSKQTPVDYLNPSEGNHRCTLAFHE